MNNHSVKIKRALLSVSDKSGLIEFAKKLVALGVELISTGGTYKALTENNIPAIEISAVTDFPEIMGGRVKTLHPKVHGAILGLRDAHQEVADTHDIQWIDLVVCNLYPFAETIKKPNVLFDDAVENIDVGGPTMVRAAAKNIGWVSVVVSTNDYAEIIAELENNGAQLSFNTRKKLAQKAFQHTAHYDAMISEYLWKQETDNLSFPEELSTGYQKLMDLRYGENPHQKACVYKTHHNQSANILNAKIHQGKTLSYNNIADADAALNCLTEFELPACVIVKHANPCGVSSCAEITKAYEQAFNADSLSAFGGVVALNRLVTKELAEKLVKIFFEIIIAPEFSQEALDVLAAKPNLRVLALGGLPKTNKFLKYRSVRGGMLVQENDHSKLDDSVLTCVTQTQATPEQLAAMQFAWKVVKHVKSNAIITTTDQVTLGIGAGQVSRVDAVDLALKKSPGELIHQAVLASDAFFPFKDSIELIAQSGIKAIIQPGGSMRDQEVIDACDQHGIAMILSGVRSFNH